MSLFLREATVGSIVTNIRIDSDRIVEVGQDLIQQPGDAVISADGGTLIPGLHDHHLHIRSLAASGLSVQVGPPDVVDEPSFVAALLSRSKTDRPGQWIRATGYHESVAGPLDRWRLDALLPEAGPIRVQHRTGALWVLNSEAIKVTRLAEIKDPGLELDRYGVPTGRCWRLDALLGERIGRSQFSISSLSSSAARHGVTGWTDANPEQETTFAVSLASDIDAERIPLRTSIMAPPGTQFPKYPRVSLGPVKIMLDDDSLQLDDVVAMIRIAHGQQRIVAVHCVTVMQILFTLAAFKDAGAHIGDRIEHGAMIPIDLFETIRDLGLIVVSQPGFIYERGDAYLKEVKDDRQDLWRLGSLDKAGIRLAAGTDAPFGSANPWRAIAAAVSRRTVTGEKLGVSEAIDQDLAVSLFSGSASRPDVRRVIAPGRVADLCLLQGSVRDQVSNPEQPVRATIVGGKLTYGSPIWE